jgi:hypothetical protein
MDLPFEGDTYHFVTPSVDVVSPVPPLRALYAPDDA